MTTELYRKRAEVFAKELAKARPAVYREVADRLIGLCAADGHGGDCPLVCERGAIVLQVLTWAAEIEMENAKSDR